MRAARDDSADRPCPNSQHPLAQRTLDGEEGEGGELSVPCSMNSPARVTRVCGCELYPRGKTPDGLGWFTAYAGIKS